MRPYYLDDCPPRIWYPLRDAIEWVMRAPELVHVSRRKARSVILAIYADSRDLKRWDDRTPFLHVARSRSPRADLWPADIKKIRNHSVRFLALPHFTKEILPAVADRTGAICAICGAIHHGLPLAGLPVAGLAEYICPTWEPFALIRDGAVRYFSPICDACIFAAFSGEIGRLLQRREVAAADAWPLMLVNMSRHPSVIERLRKNAPRMAKWRFDPRRPSLGENIAP